MALFVTNSTGTIALRKSEVATVRIAQQATVGEVSHWGLYVRLDLNGVEREILYEVDTTLEGIQAKGAVVMQLLEAD